MNAQATKSESSAQPSLIRRVLGHAVFVEGRDVEYFKTEAEAKTYAEHVAQVLGWTAKQDRGDWEVTL